MTNEFSTSHGSLKHEWVDESDRYATTRRGLNVWHLFIEKDGRGRGQAQRLLGQAQELARDGFAEFIVVNMGGGAAAREFLEAEGFTVMSCDTDEEKPESERHVDAYKEIPPYEWAGFPEDVPEERIDEWQGWPDSLQLTSHK